MTHNTDPFERVDSSQNTKRPLKEHYAAYLRELLMPHNLLRLVKALVFVLCIYFMSFTLTYLYLQKNGLL